MLYKFCIFLNILSLSYFKDSESFKQASYSSLSNCMFDIYTVSYSLNIYIYIQNTVSFYKGKGWVNWLVLYQDSWVQNESRFLTRQHVHLSFYHLLLILFKNDWFNIISLAGSETSWKYWRPACSQNCLVSLIHIDRTEIHSVCLCQRMSLFPLFFLSLVFQARHHVPNSCQVRHGCCQCLMLPSGMSSHGGWEGF